MSLFAVHRDYRWTASEIVRTTEKKTIVRGPGDRERHLMTSDVRCVLPRAEAVLLAEKLVSSEALMHEEVASAERRHKTRIDELCIAATAALAVSA